MSVDDKTGRLIEDEIAVQKAMSERERQAFVKVLSYLYEDEFKDFHNYEDDDPAKANHIFNEIVVLAAWCPWSDDTGTIEDIIRKDRIDADPSGERSSKKA